MNGLTLAPVSVAPPPLPLLVGETVAAMFETLLGKALPEPADAAVEAAPAPPPPPPPPPVDPVAVAMQFACPAPVPPAPFQRAEATEDEASIDPPAPATVTVAIQMMFAELPQPPVPRPVAPGRSCTEPAPAVSAPAAPPRAVCDPPKLISDSAVTSGRAVDHSTTQLEISAVSERGVAAPLERSQAAPPETRAVAVSPREPGWTFEVARQIVANAADPSRVVFRLQPEALGSMRVDLTTKDQGFAVAITVERDEARVIVAAAETRLTEDLRANGLRVVETSVAHEPPRDRQSSGQPPPAPPPISPALAQLQRAATLKIRPRPQGRFA